MLDFWRDAGPGKWFARDDAFDPRFREEFVDAHWAAARPELEPWMDSADGALALLLLLHHFPRNCFRGTGHAYAHDPLSRRYPPHALPARSHPTADPPPRTFL